jgi:peptide chain release factor 2
LRKCEVIFDVTAKKKSLDTLEKKTMAPDFWDDQNRARSVIDESNRLRSVIEPFQRLEGLLEEAEVFLEIAESEDQESARNQAVSDAESRLADAEKTCSRLEFQSLLSGRFDPNNAYLTLHAGAGGTESCDWAEMLLRMYDRYAEENGFDREMLEYQPGDEAGIKRASFLVKGPYAYGNLKAERGVHRLVRISPFDANKRRHTSFAALDVVAELTEDADVEVKDEDIRVDTYRASGAGGQHVNTTDSAVRITHIPSGIVVACQAERSQHMNRTKALNMLKSKLYELNMDQKRKEMERFYGQKGEIAWGSQIRSYVLHPDQRAKDHRTNVEKGNVDAVLNGDLDEFIEAYLKMSVKES